MWGMCPARVPHSQGASEGARRGLLGDERSAARAQRCTRRLQRLQGGFKGSNLGMGVLTCMPLVRRGPFGGVAAAERVHGRAAVCGGAMA